MDNTQQASFYSTLSDSRQTASHQETAASENGHKYFWVVLWGDKSQPSSSALTLKEGDGSLWSTGSVQLDSVTIKRSACWEWLTFLLLPLTFFSRIHRGPRLRFVQNMQGEGPGRWPKQVCSQSRQMDSSGYMPQGWWQNLVKLGFAQISREDLVISEN